MNGDHARMIWSTGAPKPSVWWAFARRCSSGTSLSRVATAKAKTAKRETTEPMTTARFGPMNMAPTSSAAASETPATSVMGSTPLRPLGPPPTSMTMRIGQATMKGIAWMVWVVASEIGSMAVMEARVVVGMPMEPNMVGTELAMRQARMASTGATPTATSMLAGMATAVPKPAMPSRKAPKHQPISSTSTRLSAETEQSMALIVSMPAVWTVTL